jgi:hypothetical protein
MLEELYRSSGKQTKADEVVERAAEIVQALAAKIDDENLRVGFLAAEPVQRVIRPYTNL